ncbi:MAG: HAMP domain-containing histidine kinase [Butyrivibrio sp.]|nr:HAMP domain-containing histidine kinase [Butyrivibrio sp.]
MFKKTRIKIMILITSTISLLLIATLFAISLSSYIEEYNQTSGHIDSGFLSLFEYGGPPDINGNENPPDDLPDWPEEATEKEGFVPERLDESSVELQLVAIKRFARVMVKNMIRIGIFVIIIVFIASYFVSGWIMKPLETAYKKHKQFVSDAGHELKTPVAAIDINAELLAKDIGNNKWLDSIRYESRRMNELVKQLLDLSRVENVKPAKAKVDLSELVMGSVLPYEGVAFEKGYELETLIDTDIKYNCDRNQMEQLVAILTDNAISHAEGDGSISIGLTQKGGNIYLKVTNPGKEIPREDRDNLFERFYRSDKSHTDTGHYGLGLAIAKAIVDSHKGTIDVQCSNGECEFIVKL